MGSDDLCHHHLAVVVTDTVGNTTKKLKCPNMPLPVTLRAFSLKGHQEKKHPNMVTT